jgi:hypothetical protein
MIAELTALFEQLVSELPPGTATLNLRQLPRNAGTVIELNPTNPAAADFGVLCDDVDVFNFSFGPISTWEFPYERRYRNGEKDVLKEIEEMSRAIIAGRCEVTRRWFSMTGRIYVEGYTYQVTDMPMIPRPPFGTHCYAPYADDASAGTTC